MIAAAQTWISPELRNMTRCLQSSENQCTPPPGRSERDLQDSGLVSNLKASVTMYESTESFIEAAAAGHTWERRSPHPDDDHVLAHTSNWLDALPKGVRPVHLASEFPRIANDLARLWAETVVLDLYFEDMEFSPREGRNGFPPLIKEELLAMHVYSLRNRPAIYSQRLPQQASLLGHALR